MTITPTSRIGFSAGSTLFARSPAGPSSLAAAYRARYAARAQDLLEHDQLDTDSGRECGRLNGCPLNLL